MDQQLESLYDSCRRSSELVDRFLNDKFPRGLVSATKPGYVFNGELRGQVKQKVIKSLEVLDEVLDNLTYV